MTQLTYTFAHIKVGAEKYYEEVEGFVSGGKGQMLILDYSCIIMNASFLSENPKHPLSKLANRLGATLYGGFEDEKDFHLMMPTIQGLKVGDTDGKRILAFGNFELLDDFGCIHEITGFYWKEDGEIKYNTYEQTFPYRQSQFSPSDLSEIKGNIFQEYARTGIIENDLYKQFFK